MESVSLSQQENIEPQQENIQPQQENIQPQKSEQQQSLKDFKPKKRKLNLPCQLDRSPYKIQKGQNGENKVVEKPSPINSKIRINRFENLQSHKKHTQPAQKPLSEQTQSFWNSRSGYKTEKSSAKKLERTQPLSPKFSANKRSQLRSEQRRKAIEEEISNKSQILRAHEPGVIPNYRLFEPKKVERGTIQFKEFHLSSEIRGQQKKQELEGKIQDEISQEQKQKQFQAQPMPEYKQMSSQGINTSVIKQEITQPQEFKFSTKDRSTLYSRSQLSEEKIQFKARPMPDMRQRTPSKPPVRSATKSVSPLLKSDIRAGDRKKFDESIKEKEELYNKFKQEQKQDSDDEQPRLFKSTGIRKYKQFTLQKSQIKLTEPKAPMFKTDERLNKKKITQKVDSDARSQASDPTYDNSDSQQLQQQLIDSQEQDSVNQQQLPFSQSSQDTQQQQEQKEDEVMDQQQQQVEV